MDSGKEILETFVLMGLSTAEERKRFEAAVEPESHRQSNDSYLFIRADVKSDTPEEGAEDARLE